MSEVTPKLQNVLDNYAISVGTRIASEQYGVDFDKVNNGMQKTPEAIEHWNAFVKELGVHSNIYKNTNQAILGSPLLRDGLNKAVEDGKLLAIRYDPDTRAANVQASFSQQNKSIVIGKAAEVHTLVYDLGATLKYANHDAEADKDWKRFTEGALKVLGGQGTDAARNYTPVIAVALKEYTRTKAIANIEGWNAYVSYKTQEAAKNSSHPRTADDPSKPAITLEYLASTCPNKTIFFENPNNPSPSTKLSLRALLLVDRDFMFNTKGLNSDLTVNAMGSYLFEDRKPPVQKMTDGVSRLPNPRDQYASRLFDFVATLEKNAREAFKITKNSTQSVMKLAGYDSSATVVINSKDIGLKTGGIATRGLAQYSGAVLQFEDRSSKGSPVKITLGKSIGLDPNLTARVNEKRLRSDLDSSGQTQARPFRKLMR